MKKILLLIALSLLSFKIHSQISFDKGYFIDNSNHKIECLIKNLDWKNNPIDFEYKLAENGEAISLKLESVAEFGIYNVCKYIRNSVKIDISSDKIEQLSSEKNPIFEEKLIYLKVLIEGKSNLYFYQNENLLRFFFSKENSSIEQLVCKRYMLSNNLIADNDKYKQQIWNDLKCQSIQINRLEKLKYNENSLSNIIIEYNKCNNSEFKDYKSKVKKDLFNLTFRAHLNNASLSIENYLTNNIVDFGNKTSLGFGIEAEFILPFNKNKWAISIEPSFQNYKSSVSQITQYSSGPTLMYNNSVDYSSIEIPLSLRHYMFVNSSSKFFMTFSTIIHFSFNSSLTYQNDIPLKIETIPNLAFGLGNKFKDKYSLEIRYQSSRSILANYSILNSKYSTLSLIFGYSIF